MEFSNKIKCTCGHSDMHHPVDKENEVVNEHGRYYKLGRCVFCNCAGFKHDIVHTKCPKCFNMRTLHGAIYQRITGFRCEKCTTYVNVEHQR